MQVLRPVVTLFLVANNTVGDYEPLYVVMAQPAPKTTNQHVPLVNCQLEKKKVIYKMCFHA